ncbi:unnamed protein product [Trichogramma brassicae]|uniref:Uncharacterized protein n=1 Tax=Trichogramma brassicae TaxID=86971 RepID=A0A6H5IUN9_9HYME|nr:unnamed protein product [Trichogramma brassicae]
MGHGEVDYSLKQLLSGHSYFKSHYQRYENTLSALCPDCPSTREDACSLSLPVIPRREGETSTSLLRTNRAGKHRQANAQSRRQLDGGIIFRAISRLQTEARGARDVKTIRTMLWEEDDASGWQRSCI